MENDLIYHDGVIESSDSIFSFEKCTFKRDIGPIRKGTEFQYVTFFFDEDSFYLVAENVDEYGQVDKTKVNLTVAYAP